MTEVPIRLPGRPRSPEADHAILQAALRLLAQEGYAAMSIEAVAGEAGVGKTTIYRRYRNKEDLVTAAVAALTYPGPAPDTGSVRSDLLELLHRIQRLAEPGEIMPMVGTFIVEKARNPELLRLVRERVIGPRLRLVRAVVERGMACGEIRADVDPEIVADVVFGAFVTRYMHGEPISDDWMESTVDAVLLGIAARPPEL